MKYNFIVFWSRKNQNAIFNLNGETVGDESWPTPYALRPNMSRVIFRTKKPSPEISAFLIRSFYKIDPHSFLFI